MILLEYSIKVGFFFFFFFLNYFDGYNRNERNF